MRDKQIKEMARAIYEQPTYDTYWESHCEDLASDLYNAGYRKASDVTREIFEEIEKDGKYAISFVENHKSYSEEVRQAKLECYKDIQNYIAELRKKHLGEDINAPTKESEGEG